MPRGGEASGDKIRIWGWDVKFQFLEVKQTIGYRRLELGEGSSLEK